jgi:hypothetical protein
VRHTREDVVRRAKQEFARLDRFVSRLRPTDWARRVPRPETKDPWTVKDTLAHIVYWKQHTARSLRGEKRPPDLRGLDVPRLNHVIYMRWYRRPRGDVLRWHRQVQAEVLRTLATLPAESFSRREHSASWPADLDGHSATHRTKDIEAALRT